MGKNILWVVVLGVAAGVALPLVVLHSDDIEALFVKPQPPAPPDVSVQSWVVRESPIPMPTPAMHSAELVDAPADVPERPHRNWQRTNSRRLSHVRHSRRSVPRLDGTVRHSLEAQDAAAWRDADQMLRVERSRGM